jgi:putative ABC transport system substrate-binding protein
VLEVTANTDADAQSDFAALIQSLEDLGWKIGGNLIVEIRWAGGDAKLTENYARELVGMVPDVIVAVGVSPISELRRMTSTMPIVFTRVSDPVGLGIVKNLARPGGNITGFSNFELAIGGRWLQLLKEIVPSTTHVAVIGNPRTSSALDGWFKSITAAANSLGVNANIAPVQSPDEIDRVIAEAGAKDDAGLIVVPDGMLISKRAAVIAAAAKYRVPAMYAFRFYPAEGGLVSYGVNTAEQFRRAASYIDRILRGATPGELPVQAPDKFEFVINLKTAKALGLDIPSRLQELADEVIE